MFPVCNEFGLKMPGKFLHTVSTNNCTGIIKGPINLICFFNSELAHKRWKGCFLELHLILSDHLDQEKSLGNHLQSTEQKKNWIRKAAAPQNLTSFVEHIATTKAASMFYMLLIIPTACTQNHVKQKTESSCGIKYPSPTQRIKNSVAASLRHRMN